MTQEEVLAEFRAAGALLEGHFILSSGLRSPVFLQKMRVFEDPPRSERLCRAGRADPRGGSVRPRRLRGRRHRPGLRDGAGAGLQGDLRRARGPGLRAAPRLRHPRRRPGGAGRGHRLDRRLAARGPRGGAPHPGRDPRRRCLIDRSGGRAEIGVPLLALARVDIPLIRPTRCRPSWPRSPPRSRAAARRLIQPPWPRTSALASTSTMSRPSGTRAAAIIPTRCAPPMPRRRRRRHHRPSARGPAHITDGDIDRLMDHLEIPLNLEMAATEEMLDIALRHRPHAACLVPEKREERTTEGGLDAAGQHNHLAFYVDRLRGASIGQPVHRARPPPGRGGDPARRAGRRVPHRPLRPCRRRGARRRAAPDRRRRRARRQERHRAPCRPRPDLRQCRPDRRHPAARRAQYRPFPGRRGDLHRLRGQRAPACAS